MMYIRSEHTVAIQNLKADHDNRIEELRYTMKKQLAEEQKKGDHFAEGPGNQEEGKGRRDWGKRERGI